MDEILLKPFLGKRVQLTTQSNFFYQGKVEKVTPTGLVFRDKFNQNIVFSLGDIRRICEVFRK